MCREKQGRLCRGATIFSGHHFGPIIDQLDFPVEQRSVCVDELLDAEEAFITSTSKRIVPVTMIDDKPVGNGIVGPQTRTLMSLFDRYIAEI